MITIRIEKNGIVQEYHFINSFSKFLAELLILCLQFYTWISKKYIKLFFEKNDCRLYPDSKEKLAAYLKLEVELLEQVCEDGNMEVFLYPPNNTEYILYNGQLVDERLAF